MSNRTIQRIRDFSVVADYTLRIRFEDDTEQVIDFQPMLAGQLYGPLRDLALFNQVRLDSDFHTLVWPNDADFDPNTLHDWPVLGPAMRAMADRWRSEEGGEDQ